jgi:hypothetical protein
MIAEKEIAIIKGPARQGIGRAAAGVGDGPHWRSYTRLPLSRGRGHQSLCQDAGKLEQFGIDRLDASNDIGERR